MIDSAEVAPLIGLWLSDKRKYFAYTRAGLQFLVSQVKGSQAGVIREVLS